jgi:hypothetical protein
MSMHDMPVVLKMKDSDDGYQVHDREVLAYRLFFGLSHPGGERSPTHPFFWERGNFLLCIGTNREVPAHEIDVSKYSGTLAPTLAVRLPKRHLGKESWGSSGRPLQKRRCGSPPPLPFAMPLPLLGSKDCGRLRCRL